MGPPSSSDLSSSGTFPRNPEVFISFRGTDTRSRFTSHLYEALRQKKIDAYIDDQLKTGDEISAALLSAIEKSELSIIIFSEDYASSKWCLDELVKIMECKERYGQIVVPVFYEVTPAEVRHQIGKYADAFAKYKNKFKYDVGKLKTWRKALSDAANLCGWPWPSPNFSHEANFIKAIVEDVIQKLNRNLQHDHLEHLVGIDQHTESVTSLLDGVSANVRIIGIWGMGGIGKTTIAEVVFRKLSLSYDDNSCHFRQNVREEWNKCGHLRNELLSKLLDEKDLCIDTPNTLPDFVLRRLKRKRVLIVLDDINESEQLEYLAGGRNWFGPGSIIIVTTRVKEALNDVDQTYEVKGMDFHLALELFSVVAFKQNHPPINYTELSTRVVFYVDGNPLALKVLGASLSQKCENEWESALAKQRKIGNPKIEKVLRWSYEELDDEEKTIFLEIACFFKGENESRLKILLDGCGISTVIGLRTLQEKSLITISSDLKVMMHDLIQEMGRKIIRKESSKAGERSRLWEPKDVRDVLRYNLGSDKVIGMFMDVSRIKEVKMTPDVFGKMNNLRFLSFYVSYGEKCNVKLSNDLDCLPDELRLLQWEQYPLKSLPSTYCPRNLIELNLSRSCIVRLWDGDKNLENLRNLDLSFCENLIELPDFSNAISLESINLSSCTSLVRVSSSIINLNKLTILNLGGCKLLRSVQSDIHSSSLRWLNLNGCSSLQEFSVISENMEYLNLGGTAIIELPSSIHRLKKLTELVLDSCSSLQNLIPAFDDLQSLRKISLDNCLSLVKLPKTIIQPSFLNYLSLSGSGIENLPDCIKDFSQLKILVIKDCKKLGYLPQLPSSIQRLNATDCISLTTASIAAPNVDSLLTNRDLLRPYQSGYSQEFIFYNCIGLKGALDRILADAWFRIQRAVNLSSASEVSSEVHSGFIKICLPGSKIPDWFSYPTKGLSLTIQHPSHSVTDSKLLRFAFCLVLDASTCKSDRVGSLSIGCKCHFEANCDQSQMVEYLSKPCFTEPLMCHSDHVYIWYDNLFCWDRPYGIKGRYNENHSNLFPELTFEFYGLINGVDCVKMCGVSVLKKLCTDHTHHLGCRACQ